MLTRKLSFALLLLVILSVKNAGAFTFVSPATNPLPQPTMGPLEERRMEVDAKIKNVVVKHQSIAPIFDSYWTNFVSLLRLTEEKLEQLERTPDFPADTDLGKRKGLARDKGQDAVKALTAGIDMVSPIRDSLKEACRQLDDMSAKVFGASEAELTTMEKSLLAIDKTLNDTKAKSSTVEFARKKARDAEVVFDYAYMDFMTRLLMMTLPFSF